jgi:hypothetical protein
MQRVTRSTAVAALPAPPASPGTPGYFTGGDPVGSVPATVPGYEWFNSIQEEIVAPILRAGITLDRAVQDQLRRANDRLYGGGMRTVAANTTLTADDAGVVLVDASGGARTITLPGAASMNARPIPLRIVKTDSSANAVTIQRAGSDTIEGAASIALTSQWSAAALRSDGVNAWIHQVGLQATNTTRGTVRLAQNSETDAGTSALVAVTPASLQIATRSLANPGYQRLPGGLILQFGFATSNAGGDLSIVFPLAFPTDVIAVTGSHVGTAGVAVIIVGGTLSVSGVTLRQRDFGGGGQAWQCRWMAIGY